MSKLLASYDIRTLPSPFHKVQSLHEIHNLTISQACSDVGVGRRRYYRWVNARNKGRIPNQIGRPSVLTPEQEKQLLEKIQVQASNQNSMK